MPPTTGSTFAAPDGILISRTAGVAAGRMAVATFRSVYALNFETLAGAARVESS
jgi:hypothetical protein